MIDSKTNPQFPEVIENGHILTRFTQGIQSNNLLQAYILDGPAGSGKHTVALTLCAMLACHDSPLQDSRDLFFDMPDMFSGELPDLQTDTASGALRIGSGPAFPCRKCRGCQKVFNGTSPDVRYVRREPDRVSLTVGVIRDMIEDTVYSPTESPYKVYIIEEAEKLNPQAQNAFLKTLEDPPPYVMFLLLCDGVGRLLDTVKSRVPVLRMSYVPDEQMRGFLTGRTKNDLSATEIDRIIKKAGGSIGAAAELCTKKARSDTESEHVFVDAMLDACVNKSPEKITPLLESITGKRNIARDRLVTLSTAVRDCILIRNDSSVNLRYFFDNRKTLELSGRITLRQWILFYGYIQDTISKLDANANVRLSLYNMCIQSGFL